MASTNLFPHLTSDTGNTAVSDRSETHIASSTGTQTIAADKDHITVARNRKRQRRREPDTLSGRQSALTQGESSSSPSVHEYLVAPRNRGKQNQQLPLKPQLDKLRRLAAARPQNYHPFGLLQIFGGLGTNKSGPRAHRRLEVKKGPSKAQQTISASDILPPKKGNLKMHVVPRNSRAAIIVRRWRRWEDKKGLFRLPRPIRRHDVTVSDDSSKSTTKSVGLETLPMKCRSYKPDVATAKSSTEETQILALDKELKIRELLHIIDRIYHRNKNQHRAQPWWRTLGLLRSALGSMCRLFDELPTLRSMKMGKVYKKGEAKMRDSLHIQARELFDLREYQQSDISRVESRIREALITRCYLRFSALIADKTWVSLGLVLMGILSEIVNIIGLPDDGTIDVKAAKAVEASLETRDVDVGELVTRRSGSQSPPERVQGQPSQQDKEEDFVGFSDRIDPQVSEVEGVSADVLQEGILRGQEERQTRNSHSMTPDAKAAASRKKQGHEGER